MLDVLYAQSLTVSIWQTTLNKLRACCHCRGCLTAVGKGGSCKHIWQGPCLCAPRRCKAAPGQGDAPMFGPLSPYATIRQGAFCILDKILQRLDRHTGACTLPPFSWSLQALSLGPKRSHCCLQPSCHHRPCFIWQVEVKARCRWAEAAFMSLTFHLGDCRLLMQSESRTIIRELLHC